jgi:hypothetical protein
VAEKFKIKYDSAIADHLRPIDARFYRLIERTIKNQLVHEPGIETRQRKLLLRPTVLGAAWELRFGPNNCLRVFYRTDQIRREVRILAIGVKKGNVLRIGDEEFSL